MDASANSQIVVVSTPARYMQRIADALYSSPFVVQGEVLEPGKWDRLVTKFRQRYPTLDRDRKHLHRERAAGRPAVRLIAYRKADADAVWWTLVAAAPVSGDGETWRDARRRDGRARFWSWEAVRRTRPGSTSPGWTWQVEAGHYQRLRDALVLSVRKGWRARVQLAASQCRHWPGFGPIRRQHRALGLLLERESKRRGFANPPAWPRIGYVRRLPSR